MADTTTEKMVGLDAGPQAQSPGVAEEPGRDQHGDLNITKVDWVIARSRGTGDHSHPDISVEFWTMCCQPFETNMELTWSPCG